MWCWWICNWLGDYELKVSRLNKKQSSVLNRLLFNLNYGRTFMKRLLSYKSSIVYLYISFLLQIVIVYLKKLNNTISILDWANLVVCVLFLVSVDLVHKANIDSMKYYLLPAFFMYISIVRLILIVFPDNSIINIALVISTVILAAVSVFLYISIRKDIKERKSKF